MATDPNTYPGLFQQALAAYTVGHEVHVIDRWGRRGEIMSIGEGLVNLRQCTYAWVWIAGFGTSYSPEQFDGQMVCVRVPGARGCEVMVTHDLGTERGIVTGMMNPAMGEGQIYHVTFSDGTESTWASHRVAFA